MVLLCQSVAEAAYTAGRAKRPETTTAGVRMMFESLQLGIRVEVVVVVVERNVGLKTALKAVWEAGGRTKRVTRRTMSERRCGSRKCKRQERPTGGLDRVERFRGSARAMKGRTWREETNRDRRSPPIRRAQHRPSTPCRSLPPASCPHSCLFWQDYASSWQLSRGKPGLRVPSSRSARQRR